MGVRFACHNCGKQLNIKQELAGRRGVCPDCSTRFRIPLEDSTTSSPLPTDTISLIANDPEGTWYVRPPSGGQYGPADGELLRQWISEGRVAATALIWRDGWPQWRTANEALPEIASKLPQLAQPPAPNSPEPSNPAVSINATPATFPSEHTAASQHALPAEKAPVVAGQSGIGKARQSRTGRRVFWSVLLSMIAVGLAGVLVYLINRPVS